MENEVSQISQKANRFQIEMRKAKKEEFLAIKRSHGHISESKETFIPLPNLKFKLMNFPNHSLEDLDFLLISCKILSENENKEFCKLIDAPILNFFMKVFEIHRFLNPKIAENALFTLTNITAGKNSIQLLCISVNLHYFFISLLSSDNIAERENAIWGLVNLISEDADIRSCVCKTNVISALENTSFQSFETSEEFVCSFAKFFKLLAKGPHVLNYADLFPFLPLVNHILTKCIDNGKAVLFCLGGLKEIALYNDDAIQDLIGNHFYVVISAFEIVNCHGKTTVEKKTIFAAFTFICHLTSGYQNETRIMLQSGIIDTIDDMIVSGFSSFVSEGMWALSNICCDGDSEIEFFLEKSELVQECLRIGETTEKPEILLWTLECFQNLVEKANLTQLCAFFGKNLLKLLRVINNGLSKESSEALEKVCKLAFFIVMRGDDIREKEKLNLHPYLPLFESHGIVAKIDSLYNHENLDVGNAAKNFLHAYDSFYEAEKDKIALE